MTPIRAAGLPISRWKNNAGRKADIAAGPGWTLGYAWLDEDAPFSDYSGHDRTITLVEGPGFTLDDPDGNAVVRVDTLHTPTAFDGGTTLQSRINGGVCRVLNVMTLRAELRNRVDILDAPGRIEAASPDDTRFVVALNGPVQITIGSETHSLARFDAVGLPERSAPLDHAGPDCRIALVTIRRLASATGLGTSAGASP